MTSVVSQESSVKSQVALSRRANLLAERLEQGARALAAFASELTEGQWQAPTPGDGRAFGVIVHHVGTMYPLEIQVAQAIAKGERVTGLTMDVVNGINAAHAADFRAVTKAQALELLRANSTAAAEAIRALSDEELDRAVLISLYGDAPLTCQFFIEDHALRHSYHHLARMKAGLEG